MLSNCIIRKIYCGKGDVPNDIKYSRKGDSYECLRKGIGSSDWNHRKKTLAKNSLQQIMYIGPLYESKFKEQRIYTIDKLLCKSRNMTMVEKKKLLYKVCTRKNGSIDHKAINSIILFLHERGITNLPECKIVRE